MLTRPKQPNWPVDRGLGPNVRSASAITLSSHARVLALAVQRKTLDGQRLPQLPSGADTELGEHLA